MLILLFCFTTFYGVSNSAFYDSFHGTVISTEDMKQHMKRNTTFWCINDIAPCDPNEGRRIDGSCNNLEHPTRGATHTPFYRVLPATYDEDFQPKKTKSGKEMPLARQLRTHLLSEGRIPSQRFTQLATHFFVFLPADIISAQDTVNFIMWKPYCCLPKGKTDRDCTPNKVPDDDPVFRHSDIRCLNMTRPISFQSSGCIKNDTVPERIVSSTPLFDLSNIYGTIEESAIKKARKFERGLLKYDVENGRIWPPGTKTSINLCLLNQKPAETRCHDTPEAATNTVLGINLFSIWLWRYHNLIANELANLNPCWSDDRLFYTARDINIATVLQIFYYEFLPLMLGRENMVRDGVISSSSGFRDLYNSNVLPQLSLEFPFVLRWVHTMQEGNLKFYDKHGHYLRQFPLVNLTLRTGFLAVDNNIDYITQGSFRQASANVDYVVDFDMAGIGLGPHQRAFDILTNDIAKNRYFGFQPYVKYKQFCNQKEYTSFDDLSNEIDPERIELLKEIYEHVEDIDLLAGIWMEKLIKGGSVPSTFYCLVVEQLIRNMISDRHWYERSNRPNAFTLEQLQEIRKVTVSRLLCDVADGVMEIQPHGFLRAGHK
ncbi:peroxidase-like [Galleria mellonella]|uniref:Peroxidase-like n=1 Tax=Galleria mellonella TaxID=7137 RepID=A0ABM3MH45_GALME|nr:peroxidase-like [Galleria mellonella]